MIVNSYNRNFPKRNDGYATTLAFVTSPETVIALALAGTLDFNPLTDTLTNDDGEEVRLDAPVGEELPDAGLRPRRGHGFIAPPADGAGVEVEVVPHQRPAAAARAVPGVGRQRLRRAARAAEGPGQVHHRPHLGGRPVAEVPRPPREHLRQPLPRRGQRLHRRGRRRARTSSTARPSPSPTSPSTTTRPACAWVAVGDENYGEGSSREHAAMEPRFRGAKVDHRPQLRPHPRDQPQEAGRAAAHVRRPRRPTTRSSEDDRISILGLADLAPDVPVHVPASPSPTAPRSTFEAIHTMNDEQIEWFQAGGALNIIRQRAAAEPMATSLPAQAARPSSRAPVPGPTPSTRTWRCSPPGAGEEQQAREAKKAGGPRRATRAEEHQQLVDASRRRPPPG